MATLLETVAEHEKGLVSKIETADVQAHKTIEDAHHEASSIVAEAAHQLDATIAQKRRAAADERQRAEEEIGANCQRRVAEIRGMAADKLDAVREELLSRILPGGKQGE